MQFNYSFQKHEFLAFSYNRNSKSKILIRLIKTTLHTDPSKRKPKEMLHFSTNSSTAQHYVSDEIEEYAVIPFFTSVLKKLTLTHPLVSIPLSQERMLK